MIPNILFSHGMHCKQTNDPLKQVSTDDLVDILTKDQNLKEQTKLLRTIYNIDKERYRHMKTQLPYFTCSHFDGGARGFDHFDYAIGWAIDIDADSPESAQKLKPILSDPRIFLRYISPNGYGLKLIFVFDSPCQDKVLYTRAYKVFAQELAVQYSLVDHIDMKNCDVSRICFLSHDAGTMINPLADTIDISIYGGMQQEKLGLLTTTTPSADNVDNDTYRMILERLGTKPKIVRADPYTPERLLEIVEPLKAVLAMNQIMVTEHEKVQYGVKIKANMGADQGEVIIYLGKKGWTIVTGARKGLHHPLNDVMKQLIEYHLMSSTML
jgi:hypothetical protein